MLARLIAFENKAYLVIHLGMMRQAASLPVLLPGNSLPESSRWSWHTQYPTPQGRLLMPFLVLYLRNLGYRKLSKEFSHIPTSDPVLVKCGFSAHSSVVRFLTNVFCLFPASERFWRYSPAPEGLTRIPDRRKFLLLSHPGPCSRCIRC